MFFTQEDYKKIQSWLQQNAIKDTEFKNGLSTLTGNEIIAIVQNGCNVKLHLKDFIEQLILLGLPDFANITVKFHKKNIALEEAISLIPCLSREIGQVITFVDEQGNWRLYQFQGKDVTQWNNLTLWVDLVKKISGSISWDNIEGKPEFSEVAISGDYNDLINAPTVEEIAQEVGSNIDYNDLKNTPDLADVATSGDYNDLENKPDIPEPYELPIASNTILGGVKVDGDSITIGPDGTITAHAGAEPTSDYKKLTNKPSIGGVTLEDNKTLEDLGIQPAGDYATEGSIPTKVSDLENDSGYITSDTSFDSRGTTEQRPSGLTASNAGYRYYDSTLEQAIVWNGEDWCNEDMTLLSKVTII